MRKKQREALEAKEKALLTRANEKVIAQIVALARRHNFTPMELAASPFSTLLMHH